MCAMFGNYSGTTTTGGGALARQLSKSMAPMGNAEYMDRVFQNRKVHEAGWLEMLQPNKTWTKRYFVFENEVIKYSHEENARDELWTVIQIRDVVSFRVETMAGRTTSLVVLTREHDKEKKLTIRASSQDEMNKWQFALHKTVAVLFPKLLESRKIKLQELQQRNRMRSGVNNHVPSVVSSCSTSTAPISIGITHNVSDVSEGGCGITTTTTTINGVGYDDLDDDDDGGSDTFRTSPVRMERRRSSSDHMGNIHMSNFLLDSTLDLDTSASSGVSASCALGGVRDSSSSRSGSYAGKKSNLLSQGILIPEGGGELTSLNTMDGHVSRSLQYTTRRFLKPDGGGGFSSEAPSGTQTTETTPPPEMQATHEVGGYALYNKKFSFDRNTAEQAHHSSGSEPSLSLNVSGSNSKCTSAAGSFVQSGIPIAGSAGRPSGLTAALHASSSLNSSSASIPHRGGIGHAGAGIGTDARDEGEGGSPMQQLRAVNDTRMERFNSGGSDSSDSSMNPFKDTGPISAEDLLDCSGDNLDQLDESLEESLGEFDRSLGDSMGVSREFRELNLSRDHSNSEELFDFDDGSSSPDRSSRSGSAVGSAAGASSQGHSGVAGASVGTLPIGIGSVTSSNAPYGNYSGSAIGGGLSASFKSGSLLGGGFQGASAAAAGGAGAQSSLMQSTFANTNANTGGAAASSGMSYNRVAGSIHKSSGIMNSLGTMHMYMGVPNATSLQWRIGACSLRGKRSSNEDRYVAVSDLREEISGLSDRHRQQSTHQRKQDLPERIVCKVNMLGSCGTGVGGVGSSGSGSGTSTSGAGAMDPDAEAGVFDSVAHLYVHHRMSDSSSSNLPEASGAASPERESFFAVYDGHCGDTASIHCANNLHLAIARHPDFRTDLPNAIIETCSAFDTKVVDYSVSINKSPGTTALGIFIIGSKLTMFGIGDCHAILCQNGSVCKDLSHGHKPGMESEKARILAGGGWVTEEKELYLARLHQMDLLDPVIQKAVEQMNFVTINRVCGEMSIARSIGDSDYKAIPLGEELPEWQFVWPEGHNRVISAPLIIPTPEIFTTEITTEDSFIILGSDGLWDVITTDLACKRVNDLLLKNQLSLDEIAEDMCQLAIRLGSEDNITCIIVVLEHDNIIGGY